MKKEYYNPEDLKKFGEISKWNKELGDRFFEYYNKVFENKENEYMTEKQLIELKLIFLLLCSPLLSVL